MKKRLFSILSIIACLSLLFAVQFTGVTASAEEAETTGQTYSASDFSFYTDPWIEAWLSGDLSAVENVDSQYKAGGLVITYDVTEEDYSEMIEKAGAFKEYEEAQCTSTEESVVITKNAVCENRTVVFTFNYSLVDYSVLWTVDVEKTMGEVLKNAGLNTVLGMGTVFVVLILISAIISLFGVFRKIAGKKPAKEEIVVAPAAPVAEVVAQTSDDEIIAVISAAIAAYEEEEGQPEGPVDGLVVRSIKKRGFN